MYRSLDHARREIRVLTVECADSSPATTVRCSLGHISLDSQPPIKYETISYCWGDARQQAKVLLDGHSVLVPATAERALQRMRLPDRERVLWIDAVCINQQDPAERSQQVSMMSSIYAGGRQNLIWLGEEKETTVTAIETINHIIQDVEHETQGVENLAALLYDRGSRCLSATGLSFPLASDALLNFYSQPWFRRLWVIQECALAPYSVCYCGRWEVPGSDVLQAAKWLQFKREFLPFSVEAIPGIVAAANMLEIADHKHGLYNPIHGVQMSLTGLLARSREAQVSDIRDKIFGVLGLYLQGSTFEEIPPLLEPDYTKSAASVLTDASRQAILDDGHLGVLLSLSHRPEPCSQDVVLPSWVPSWHYHFDADWDPYDLSQDLFNADDNVPLDLEGVSVVDESDVVLLRGYHVDTVSLTTELINNKILLSATRISYVIRTLQYWLSTRALLNTPEKGRNTPTTNMLAMTLIGGEGFASRRANWRQPADDQDVLGFLRFMDSIRRNAEPPLSIDDNHTIEERLSPEFDASRYLAAMQGVCNRRCVYLTTAGCLGVGPQTMQENDIITVLFGSILPVVLRPHGSYFEVVGICYMFGIMNGEAVRKAQTDGETPMTFRIR